MALTTLTVLPLRPGPVNRSVAGVAMSLAPAVGAAIGVVVAAAGVGAYRLGAPRLAAGVLVVALGVLFTRGLHVDGLADTVDGLGSYRGAEDALAIMRRPDVGAFGVAAVTLSLLAQAAAAAALVTRDWLPAVAGIVAATATGRVALALACRRGVPAARPEGLGAMVAGTVPPLAVLAGALGAAAVSIPAVDGRPWQGPIAVAIALGLALLLIRHAVRRLTGITGDVLGAACEVAVTLAYFTLAI